MLAMSKRTYYIERFSAIVASIILLQTLYYKFTGHNDSVFIFTMMEMEPQGRIILGIIEFITAFLLLYTRTAHFGGLIATSIMLGAILSHAFVLGIEVKDDGGTLFILALIAFATSLYVFFARSDAFYEMYLKMKERKKQRKKQRRK